MSACDTGRVECEDCERPRCRRCGRCCERRPATVRGTWKHYCPSWPCSAVKTLSRLAGRPYTRRDTPDV